MVLALLTLALTAAPGRAAAVGVATKAGTYQTPAIKHVWFIILENKSYEAAFTGLNKNSYLWQTLPSYGVLLRQYYGTGHNSENNYLSLLSGQSPAPAVQQDCPRYVDVSPGTPAPDGQTYAASGCVYPASVPTLAGQLTAAGVSWKGYMQDMGNNLSREQPTCGSPRDAAGGSSPTYPGLPAPSGAAAGDLYVPKHNPFVWFHSVIDSPSCATNVVPLDTVAAGPGRPASSGLLADLGSAATTPAFSWITPNLCYDAHDSTCPTSLGVNGGLDAADAFLKTYIPAIMASPAYQDGGLIDIGFDEGYPPYMTYGNSYYNLPGMFNAATNTAQSVVACCNELPGPNTYEPGNQLFGQDTTPGGGVTGSVLLSRYITPGTISDQPYNHYSWLRSMEDLFAISTGGTDGAGHLGYAGAAGLRPFGPDVYNNPTGAADQTETTPVPSGTNGTFAGRSGTVDNDAPPIDPHTGRPIPDSKTRPYPLYVPVNVDPAASSSPAQPTYPSPTAAAPSTTPPTGTSTSPLTTTAAVPSTAPAASLPGVPTSMPRSTATKPASAPADETQMPTTTVPTSSLATTGADYRTMWWVGSTVFATGLALAGLGRRRRKQARHG